MFHAKLQMRLESSEPKCANCGAWFPASPYVPSLGYCGLARPDDPESSKVVTTDLQVCSKWKGKDDAQQTQEADAASR